MILVLCGGLALGFGLALGLGGRDVMAGILAGYYLRQRLASGDTVEVAGLQGTVREVGPVATVIETDEQRPDQSPYGAQHQDAQRSRSVAIALRDLKSQMLT